MLGIPWTPRLTLHSMSGVKRAIQAEMARKGQGGGAVASAFSPEAMRAEKGRTTHSPAGKKADGGDYLGKTAKDATPRK